MGVEKMVCDCFFLASSLCKFKSTRRKRGTELSGKSWIIKYNHYQIVFSESTYMYVVNG